MASKLFNELNRRRFQARDEDDMLGLGASLEPPPGPSTADRFRIQREERAAMGPSPTQLRRLDAIRQNQFRKMNTAPPGPMFNTAGGMVLFNPFHQQRQPFSAQEAASVTNRAAMGVQDKTGAPLTDYGSELNRFTAPGPMEFAEGARAPEAIEQKLALGQTGIDAATLANRGAETELDYLPQQLQQGLDVGGQALTEAQAEAVRREQLFGPELEQAGQQTELGQLEIDALNRQIAGAPPADVMRTREEENRAFEMSQRDKGVSTGDEDRLISQLNKQIELATLEGDIDEVRRLQQKSEDIITGFQEPRAPTGTIGGAPTPVSRNVNPVALQRRGAEATAIGQAVGLEGAIAMLTDVASDRGWANEGSDEKLQLAADTIKQALEMSPNEQARDIIRSQIRNTEGYLAIKQRAKKSDAAGKRFWGTLQHPISSFGAALTGAPYNEINRMQVNAAQIVELVEGQ